jgi:hypothetical protein
LSTHEDLHRQLDVKGGSDRSFGWVFICFFLIVGLSPLRHHQPIRLWALAVSGVFLVPTLIKPKVLHPLNVLWTRLGVLLGRVVAPIVLSLLFFLVVTPMACVMRLMGKRPLQLHMDPGVASYWIHRQPPGPAPESMINQF